MKGSKIKQGLGDEASEAHESYVGKSGEIATLRGRTKGYGNYLQHRQVRFL